MDLVQGIYHFELLHKMLQRIIMILFIIKASYGVRQSEES